MKQARHRALFVGCGGPAAGAAGKFLRLPETQIVGLVDPVAGAAERIGAPADTPAFAEFDEALEHCDANLAFIATPNRFHAEQFVRCAERGWHVWVEKPVALTIDEALRMSRAAQQHKIKVATPYMVEHDTFMADAAAAYRRGDLGRLVQVATMRTGSNGFFSQGFGGHRAVLNPQVSGGWILHHLCHVVDWAMCIGGPVRAVTCRTHTTVPNAQPDSRQEESVTCMLDFERGGAACLIENQLRYKYHRYAVMGERGGIFIENHPRATGEQTMVSVDTEIDGQSQRRTLTRDGYIAETAARPSPVQRLLEAIEQDLPSPVPLERSIQVLSVCMALIAAASARNQWVRVESSAPAGS